MQSRTISRAVRVSKACALLLALLLTQPGTTTGGRGSAIGAAPSICQSGDRPWLLDAELDGAAGDELRAAGDTAETPLRVVTYNIHSGLGEHHALWRTRAGVEQNLRAIASDIAGTGAAHEPPDVVALNEVDFDSRRSAGIDEAAFLADDLALRTGQRYQIVRGETWRRDFPGMQVRFGNALLVRLPVVASSACLLTEDGDCQSAPRLQGLPSLRSSGWTAFLREPRGVIKATVRAGDRLVDILVTHLDPFAAAVREAQALHILRRFVDPARTTVLLGDLNAVATVLTGGRRFFGSDRTLDILTSATLADTRTSYASEHALVALDQWATYPAGSPRWSLDAVLASADLATRDVRVIGTTASDHRGLFALLALVRGEASLLRQQARHDRIRVRQLERILQCDIATADARRERGWLVAQTGFAAMLTR